MFLNSIIVTTSSVILIITLSIFAAFSFSHLRFPMKESLYNVMIASVAMPAQVLLIPLFYLLIYFGIIIIAFLVFAGSTGVDLSGLIVAGGIFGVVIGFATQSVVSNLISGIFLMIEKPVNM